MSKGFLIGKLQAARPSLLGAVKELFDPKLPSDAACERFLAAIRKKQETFVRIDPVHVAVFAPAGAGKSTGLVIPNLLTCEDSCVVVDFKGELYKATARQRRAMGHRIAALDPFYVVTQNPDTFNPVEFIDKDSRDAPDHCRDLAESLTVRTGMEHERHWDDSAEINIAAMLAAVVQFAGPQDKTLQSVRDVLASNAKRTAAMKMMQASPAWDGMLARLGNALEHYVEKELGGVLTTVTRHLRFLDTPAVAESTRTSSFDPSQLVKGKMTVYLILPPQHMRACAGLLRMWLGSLLRAVVSCGLQETRKVHFVIDEAASLQQFSSLEDAVDKYRGYGVRLQLYYQSLGQLKKCFPNGQDVTLLSNCTQVYFGVNENETANFVSTRGGDATIVVESGGTSGGTSTQTGSDGQAHTSYSSNWSENWQQLGRRLYKPEEIMSLDERVAITFHQGLPPIRTELVRHYEKDFGRKPNRLKAAARALYESVILLIAAGLAALALTHVTSNQGMKFMPGEPVPVQNWHP